MMRSVFVLMLAGLLAACSTAPRTAGPVDGGKPVFARYVGTLPCADCSGVRTDLILYAEESGTAPSYLMRETYVGARDVGHSQSGNGSWSQRGEAAGGVLQLKPASSQAGDRYFRQVGEQVLRALDGNQSELPPNLPRSLLRVPPDIESQATVLTAGDNGSLVDLRAGSSLVVMLAANRSTGHRWQPLIGNNDVVVPVSARTYVTDSQGALGGGGIEVFRFDAPTAGLQILRFEYRRPWEPAAPSVQAVSFTLRVQ